MRGCGLVWLVALLAFISPMSAFPAAETTGTVYLVPGTSIDVTAATAYGSRTLSTYCYPGKRLSVLSLFETVEFVLNIGSDDYTEYGGKTPEEVLKHYNVKKSVFSVTLFSQKRQRIPISPFDQQCIGVATRQPYVFTLYQSQVDLMRLVQLAVGVILFLGSRRLARNAAFYYLAGGSVGIFASILVIIYFTSKLFPRRPMMYGVLVGGWTIGFYVIKQLTDNIRTIVLTYRDYVVWYLVVTGLVSFFVCYRFGPPKNPRSQTIIMWVLQAIGAALMYFSSWHTSAVIFLVVVLFAGLYFPKSLIQFAKRVYRRRFPPKRRFLTQEEFYDQSAIETAKSLAALRTFVNSPECKQWSVMANLRNPMRFATFANGAPHLFDQEIEDYTRDIQEAAENAEENVHYRPNEDRLSSPNQRQRHRVSIPRANSRNALPADMDSSHSEGSSSRDEDEYLDQEPEEELEQEQEQEQEEEEE